MDAKKVRFVAETYAGAWRSRFSPGAAALREQSTKLCVCEQYCYNVPSIGLHGKDTLRFA